MFQNTSLRGAITAFFQNNASLTLKEIIEYFLGGVDSILLSNPQKWFWGTKKTMNKVLCVACNSSSSCCEKYINFCHRNNTCMSLACDPEPGEQLFRQGFQIETHSEASLSNNKSNVIKCKWEGQDIKS